MLSILFDQIFDMKKACMHIIICRERPIISIVAMGGDEYVFRAARCGCLDYYESMPKNVVRKRQLNQISGHELINLAYACYRTYGVRRSCKKLIEIRDTCPCGGFAVCIYVVPAKCGQIVHDTSARAYALGSKVCAVTP